MGTFIFIIIVSLIGGFVVWMGIGAYQKAREVRLRELERRNQPVAYTGLGGGRSNVNVSQDRRNNTSQDDTNMMLASVVLNSSNSTYSSSYSPSSSSYSSCDSSSSSSSSSDSGSCGGGGE